MTEYTYQPLPRDSSSKWIRVLDLLPSPAMMAPVHCRLRPARIDAEAPVPPPRYKAISYAWSERHASPLQPQMPSSVPIFCDGRVLRIQPNLLYALFRLRSRRSEETVTLWADAICINQADVEERNHQVSLMRDIYASCQEVIIWLGETIPLHEVHWVLQFHWLGGESDSDLSYPYEIAADDGDYNYMIGRNGQTFVDLIERPRNAVPLGNGEDLPGTSIGPAQACDYFGAFCLLSLLFGHRSLVSIIFYKPRSVQEGARRDWAPRVQAALWALVNRLWWKRIWVIQECVLARLATVMFGNMKTTWKMLVGFAKQLTKDRGGDDLSNTSSDPLVVLSKLILEIESQRRYQSEGISPSLVSLLRLFRSRDATDPRDKVFGLLGLLDAPPIKPDYSGTAEDVFKHTAVLMIAKTKKLGLLSGERPESDRRIPTWCVDWHIPTGDNEWLRIKCLDNYNASKDWMADIYLHKSRQGLLLGLDGLMVDRVGMMCSQTLPETGFARLKATHDQWFTQVRRVSREKFWRALCGDIFYDETDTEGEALFVRAPADGAQNYAIWLRDHVAYRNRKSSMYDGHLRTGDVLAGLTTKRNQFSQSMQIMTGRRRMFLTESGRIGVGPATTEVGDLVVILPGSQVPLILAESHEYVCSDTDTFRLVSGTGEGETGESGRCSERHACHMVVGDAYVSGLMDGEAIGEDAEGSLDQWTQKFFLC